MIPLTNPAPTPRDVTPDELEAIADEAGVGVVTLDGGVLYAVVVDRVAESVAIYRAVA